MLDREQVHKVAHLARLKLTEAEETQFATQLSGILDYVEQLNQLDVSNVEPTTRAIDVANVVREDKLQPWESREDLLDCAPDRDGEFFRVPKISTNE
ncbi:MAG: Asp-tRNA(Asn)/Glu-tRNA(Gln) amidotransferase subunit GatC [Alkalinema sp. RL_2_19]|nr:Asp-tRNA(Asn)/Glu-tRNA(Gln) amidotransferase subunit GatC [Alkalinema sp. RL_2_19]